MTPEEITLIRTALRSHGEKIITESRSRKWGGPQFRKNREEMRDDARPYLRLADQPDEYFTHDDEMTRRCRELQNLAGLPSSHQEG